MLRELDNFGLAAKKVCNMQAACDLEIEENKRDDAGLGVWATSLPSQLPSPPPLTVTRPRFPTLALPTSTNSALTIILILTLADRFSESKIRQTAEDIVTLREQLKEAEQIRQRKEVTLTLIRALTVPRPQLPAIERSPTHRLTLTSVTLPSSLVHPHLLTLTITRLQLTLAAPHLHPTLIGSLAHPRPTAIRKPCDFGEQERIPAD